MTTRMLIDGLHQEEIRVVIAQDSQLLEFDIESSAKKQNKGNIYLAKVTRVEPSLQAAFVEYGSGRQGFLPFSEIHPDYYQIPVADKQALLAAQAAEREAEQRKIEEELEQAAANHSEGQDENQPEEIVPLIPQVAEQGDEVAEPIPAVEGDAGVVLPASANVVEQVSESVEESQGQQDQTQEEQSSQESNTENNASAESSEDRPQERRKSYRRYKIQEVIKKGQVVLIQIVKEERGNKGASVTTYLSIPGRYSVLMPNTANGGGVSRKINDMKERRRLKDMISGLDVKPGMSVILRTAGAACTKPEITRDYSYLIRLWNSIREATLKATAPALVYEEGSVIKRTLRDFYSNDIEEVIVSGDAAFEFSKDFMKMIAPTHVKKIIKHEDPTPVFNYYDVEHHLTTMYDPVVVLRSGGYIVINSTEALISIDVNSGRATGERNVEDTATRTNIDAAYEIARQLRLRDLSGLIVIDFIDMMDSRHRRQVERALKDALRVDRAKIQVGRISPFGLLEMSRQRLRSSLTEINMVECPSCRGTGIIRSPDSAMVQLARSIENELAIAEEDNLEVSKVVVTTSVNLALYFLNNKRKHISELEEKFGFELVVDTAEMAPSSYKIQLEYVNGNKSAVITSEDRDVRLPQSRESGRNRKRDRKQRNGRDRSKQRPELEAPQAAPEGDVIDQANHFEGEEIIPENVSDGSNIEEVVDPENQGGNRRGGRGRHNNNNRRGGGRNNDRRRNNNRRGGDRRRDGNREQGQQGEAQQGDQGGEVVDISSESQKKVFEPKVPYNTNSAPQPKEAPVYSTEEIVPDNVEKGNRKGWWRKIIE